MHFDTELITVHYGIAFFTKDSRIVVLKCLYKVIFNSHTFVSLHHVCASNVFKCCLRVQQLTRFWTEPQSYHNLLNRLHQDSPLTSPQREDIIMPAVVMSPLMESFYIDLMITDPELIVSYSSFPAIPSRCSVLFFSCS